MTTQADTLTLRLERLIAAPPERVFAAWTQPELLRWSSSIDNLGKLFAEKRA